MVCKDESELDPNVVRAVPVDPLDPTGVLAELGAILRSADSLKRVAEGIVSLARSRIPGADEVSLTVITAGRPGTIASTGEVASELDERQYAAGWGPCLDAVAGGEPLAVDDIGAETAGLNSSVGRHTSGSAPRWRCRCLSRWTPAAR